MNETPVTNGKHDVWTHRIVVSCLGLVVLMTGASITLCKLDSELEKLLHAPADCAFWQV